MKRIYYFFRAHLVDFITAIIGILLAIGTFVYFSQAEKRLVVSIIITVVALLVIIYARRKRSFIFSALTWRRDKEPLIGRGNVDLSKSQKAFSITDADPGYIHSGSLTWADYQFVFDFKVAKEALGVIVRAVNLANYAMLQIRLFGIRPHIRINGGWKRWEADETALRFMEPLSLDRWYECEVLCEKEVITIRIRDGSQLIFDRTWMLPIGSIAFVFSTDERRGESFSVPFSISLEYGSIGFRNWGDEKAFVRNVLIQKL